MKIKIIILSLLAVLMSVSAYAAGSSCTITTPLVSRDFNTIVIHVACIADDTDGSVPVVNIKPTDLVGVPHDYTTMDMHLWEVWSLAKSPAPDVADVAITDRFGFSLFSEVGLITASGSKAGTIAKSAAVTSPLTLTQTNQDTVDAQWVIAIKLVRIPKQ